MFCISACVWVTSVTAHSIMSLLVSHWGLREFFSFTHSHTSLYTTCRNASAGNVKWVVTPQRLSKKEKTKLQRLALFFKHAPCGVYNQCTLGLLLKCVFNDAWFSPGERGRGRPRHQLYLSSLHAGFQQPWETHLPCLPGENSVVSPVLIYYRNRENKAALDPLLQSVSNKLAGGHHL